MSVPLLISVVCDSPHVSSHVSGSRWLQTIRAVKPYQRVLSISNGETLTKTDSFGIE